MYSVRLFNKTEMKQAMIKKYSDEKRQEVIDARKAGATIAQIAALGGVSMAERCRLQNYRDIKAGFKILIIRQLPYNSRKSDFF